MLWPALPDAFPIASCNTVLIKFLICYPFAALRLVIRIQAVEHILGAVTIHHTTITEAPVSSARLLFMKAADSPMRQIVGSPLIVVSPSQYRWFAFGSISFTVRNRVRILCFRSRNTIMVQTKLNLLTDPAPSMPIAYQRWCAS